MTMNKRVNNPNGAPPRHGHATRKHGITSLYRSWCGMKERTTNPNYEGYHRYGGRGIKVWPQWFNSFDRFLAYVTRYLGPRPTGWLLDRIDNDKNYEPGNIRWASPSLSAKNRGRRMICKRGHILTEENTYTFPDGRRHCKTCRRVHFKRYKLRKKGVPLGPF